MIFNKKHNIFGITRILVLMLFYCLFCINSTGQESDCISIVAHDTIINFSTNKKPNEAHIRVEMCYNKDKNINITLKRPYFLRNGERLTDQKVKRQGHQLFLKGISHYRIDLYKDKLNLDTPELISDSLTFYFMSKDSVFWTNDNIEFTIKFLYQRGKKELHEGDVTINFKLPDNPEPAELREKEEKSTLIQDNGTSDTSKIAKVGKQPKNVIPAESKPENISEISSECIDSVKYYYHKLFDLWGLIQSNNSLTNDIKKSLGKQFDFYNNRFNEFIDSCEYQGKNEYKRNYDAIDNHLRKALEVGSETNEVNLINNNGIETKIEKTIDVKDILLYVLSVFFVILAIAYVFSKIKRKRK